jgi:NitT/TauT family transport system ATP-binding protein
LSIWIKNLNKSYHDLKVYKNFNIKFEKNKINTLLGPSGCGKTTLINIIAGLSPYDSGHMEGLDFKNISYIFQEPRLIPWLSVYDNIDFVLKGQFEQKKRSTIINSHLELVNLQEFKDYYPENLSGGMKQRVSIARAFSYPSNILLMDEPFKGLDINLKHDIINSFIKLYENKPKTIIYVTHHIDESLLLSDHIYILNNSPVEIIEEINIFEEKKNRNLNDEYFIDLKEYISSKL